MIINQENYRKQFGLDRFGRFPAHHLSSSQRAWNSRLRYGLARRHVVSKDPLMQRSKLQLWEKYVENVNMKKVE